MKRNSSPLSAFNKLTVSSFKCPKCGRKKSKGLIKIKSSRLRNRRCLNCGKIFGTVEVAYHEIEKLFLYLEKREEDIRDSLELEEKTNRILMNRAENKLGK